MNKSQDKFYQYVHPINNVAQDYDALLNHIADASVVLLGEATHGTHEFYETRATITKRLIQEKGFNVIAIEGDWPDTYRINRYINNEGDDNSSIEALSDFKRFPSWMWRNHEIVSLIDWLKKYNTQSNENISFYGLDVYSLHQSIEIIINQLEKINPESAKIARARYSCFDSYANPQEYGHAASLFPDASCQKEAIEQLIELRKKKSDFFKDHALNSLDEKFYLEQNALVIKNAEEYYRSLFDSTPASSWNIRDKHMMSTLNAIIQHKRKINNNECKTIIWAHNSHIGNAQATQMSSYGEINLGQLVKEAYGPEAISIGFTTYSGTVSAASAWGGAVERKFVRPAQQESIEFFFHECPVKNFVLIPNEYPEIYDFFSKDYLERAIGVIYQPATERQSHYFYAQLNQQFDAIIHFDYTHALEPLDKTTEWEQGEDVPETFPFGV